MDSGNISARPPAPPSDEERMDAIEAAIRELREEIRQLWERATMGRDGSPEG